MPTANTHPRFTFLGTGTSGGIPLIACDCPVCTSADPRDTRTRTGACVRWIDRSPAALAQSPGGVERVVLIDCTPDLHAQARREGLWRCDAILFTHNHVDHIFGLDEVRRFNAVMKAPIDIHAEGYVLDALRRVYKHIFDAAANVNDSFVATLIPHTITPVDIDTGRPRPHTPGTDAHRDFRGHNSKPPRESFDPVHLFGMRFEPLRLHHGRLPILGWRVEEVVEWSSGQVVKREGAQGPPALDHSTPRPLDHSSPFPLAYCTDVSAIPPDTWPRLTGLKTLVLDALRHRHHPTHLTLDQAVTIAQRVGAEQTYFVHMAHELGHEQTDSTLPPNIRLAHDGLTLGPSAPPGSAWRPTHSASRAAAKFEEG
ncbi:MAG: MBL fold metallo-hydrolase [Phycisphaerales bacterium]